MSSVLGLQRVCPRKSCPWPWPRTLCPRLHLWNKDFTSNYCCTVNKKRSRSFWKKKVFLIFFEGQNTVVVFLLVLRNLKVKLNLKFTSKVKINEA